MTETQQLDRPGEADPAAEQADLLVEPVVGPLPEDDSLTKKSEWSNWTVLAMIVLCFFVLIRFRPFDSRNPQRRPGVGRKLSGLSLQPLGEGLKPVRLADLTGRVVLINFWGPSSSTSRDALPHIAQIQKQFQDRSAFKLLSVSCRQDADQELSELRRNTWKVLRKKKVELSIYADNRGISRKAVDQAVGLNTFPTTLILDRRGQIRGVWAGFRPGAEEEMQELITRLLAEA